MSYNLSVIHQHRDTPLRTAAIMEPLVIELALGALKVDPLIFSNPFEPDCIEIPFVSQRQLLGAHRHSDLASSVQRAVSEALGNGLPTLSAIASDLGIGTRTLQRRLSATGHSFQGLVDMARKDAAQRLLRETEYSLAEIAFLTGFSEQSGFTRAFKRWAGQTPRSYRVEVSSGFDLIRENLSPQRKHTSSLVPLQPTDKTKERDI